MIQEKSFYIETYGCASNKADSNIITTILIQSDYVQRNLEDAEFVIINTCAVKQQTENKIKSRLRSLYQEYRDVSDKFFVIAGCLPRISKDYMKLIPQTFPTFSAIIDLDTIDELPLIFDRIKSGAKNIIVNSDRNLDKAQYMIKVPKGKITGIVPISEGCEGSCTYCCVKNARGKLNCYDSQNILKNARNQLESGVKQLYLTSQDCSVYQYNDSNLRDLVSGIVNLDFKFFLRIGMLNPRFLVSNLDQLLSIFTFNKVYHFLHIPIQSGSDQVLGKMKRPYSIAPIIEKINLLRSRFPYLTISTDIICGFPGETETDFQKTTDLIHIIKPEILNISKFTIRPATKAKQMEQLDSKIIKKRSILVSKIFRNSLLDMNEKWNDWRGEALILHKGLKPNQAFGRNFAYKNIFIDDYNGEYGKFVEVKIHSIDGFNLYATIC
jgi:threonylcarbamoyladenosine tRNA methylthiotransferase CDKAL1